MRLLPFVLCASVFLGSAVAQSTTPGSGPCALLTQAEVQQAVGTAVSNGAINSSNKAVCDFVAGASGSVINVSLTPRSPDDSVARTIAELKKHRIIATAVAGLGDGAYASSPGFGMQQIGAYKGTSHVIVTVLLFGAPEAKSKAVAKALMQKALARAK
jgi:hypothetical protein